MSMNAWREVLNDNEEVYQKKKSDPDSLATKVYNWFVEKGINDEWVIFVNRIMSLSDTDVSYQDEVMTYINSQREFDELWEDFKSKMSLWKIKARLAPEFSKFKSRRSAIKSSIIKYFDVSESQYTQSYESAINTLSQEQLINYERSSEALKKFFEDNDLAIPEKRNIKWFLETFNIPEKLKSFSQEKRDEINYLLQELINQTSINSPLFWQRLETLIQRLIAENIFDPMQKKELILAFIPSITLSKIQDFKLLAESDIDDYLTSEFLDWVDAKHKAESLKQLKIRAGEIEIPTTLLKLNSDKILNTVIKNSNFKRLVNEIQDFHNINNPNAINDFEVLIDTIASNLVWRVSWIENLKAQNILVLHWKKWSADEVQYHEIISTKSENEPKNRVVFRSRWGNWVYDVSSDNYEYLSYWEFYELLSDQKKISSWEFLPKNLFEEMVKSWEISQVEGEYDFEVTNTEESFNKDRLRQAIDLLDTDWKKYWLDIWTTFRTVWTLQNDGDDLYTVVSIDESVLPNWVIELVNIDGKKEKIGFEKFFETWKAKKTKRISRAQSWEEFLHDLNAEKSIWSQVKFEGWRFINQWAPKWSQELEYLVSDKKLSLWWDINLIKIHSINGSSAKVSFWKYEWKVLPDSTKWKKWEPAKYSVWSQTSEVTLGMLAGWTKEVDLKWKNLKAENTAEKLPEWAKISSWFFSNYVNNFANLASLMAAGKTWWDNMKNYFEEGTNEQAMKLASKLPVFSEEQKSAMKMRLEQSEKKHTDEALEKLKVLDSWPSTELVYKWLSNKHTTESRKVAALLYMLEKYGVLYEKDAMIKHKWTFLFYRAFWWEIWDELYMQYKDECERATPPKQFLEEDLMYKFISLRCKWKIKPPLRWRLYKEIEAIMWKWLTDELEKWKWDADKKGTFTEKEGFAFWELEDGWYPNAMWAFDSMVNKWNTPQRLNKLPFVMLTSWAAKSFSAQLTNKFKLWNLVLTTFFTHSSAHTDLFNRVVISLCRDIENKLWGRYKWMWEKADKLINGMSGKSEKERIKAAKEFYESEDGLYEDVLWRALLMMNTQRWDKVSQFETWLRDNSDTNPDYKEYCSLIWVAFEMWAEKFFWEQQELLKDAFHIGDSSNWGMSWIELKAFVEKFLLPQNWWVWFRNLEMWNKLWKEITTKIDVTSSWDLDDEYKRKRIATILTDLMDGLLPTYAQRNWEIQRIMDNPAATFYTRFHEWWVRDSDFALWWESFKNSKKWQEVIHRYVDNILSKSWPSASSFQGWYKMKDLTSQVQSWVASNLNQNPYDDFNTTI